VDVCSGFGGADGGDLAASAAEPARDRAPRQGATLRPSAAEPLAVLFPVHTGGEPVRIEAELRLNGEVIMAERRSLPAEADRVRLFTRVAGHFEALRDQDARNPGRVQLRISQNGAVVVDMSLTEFDVAYPEAPARRPRRVATNGPCEDNCELYYQDCLSWCDPRGSECANCWYQYENCIANCPTCDDWNEVSRTRIGRRFDGSASYFGVQYCFYDEYYLVEESNAAGCYPNRTVCDIDEDTVWLGGGGIPSQNDCCDEDQNSEHWCGGDTCS
jgi:hypothetical protein